MWDDEMDSISTPATSSSAWDSYTRTHASAKPIFHTLLYRLEGLKVTQGLQRHGISDLFERYQSPCIGNCLKWQVWGRFGVS